MPAPRYRRGSIPRDIMDVLKDAPGRSMKRAALVRVIAKRRGTTVGAVRNAIAVALYRMIHEFGDVEKRKAATYTLTGEPVPDRYDSRDAWKEEEI